MFEARQVLEVQVAGLAAERATAEHLATLSEEIAEMYAALDDPQQYLNAEEARRSMHEHLALAHKAYRTEEGKLTRKKK